MKSDKELGDEREALVEKLKARIKDLENDLGSARENFDRDLRRSQIHRYSEIQEAHGLSREIFSLIEDRFGRKVREEMELDLKCRRM